MTPSKDIAVEIRNITYGYRKSFPVLRDISFTITQKDYLVIIGPNGGGKTTLLKIIAGLLTPWKGEVIFYPSSLRKKIGYVPQFSNFDRNVPLRVLDVIKMGDLKRYCFLRPSRGESDRIPVRLAEKLKLDHLLQTPVSELSGGQMQRVLIARALLGDPGILLFDEPTASIDSESRHIFQSVIRELNQNIPVVMVTHEISAIAQEVKHIACINQKLYIHDVGKVTEETLEKVYGCPVDLIAHGVPHRVLKSHNGQ